MPQMAVMLSSLPEALLSASDHVSFRSSFQSFIIHHPAFDGVVLGIACDLTRTFGLNYPEIPDCYFTLVSIRWFSLTSFTALSTCTVIGNISTVARRSALYPFAVRYFRSLASVAESQLT